MLTNTHFHGLVKLAGLFINDRQFAVFSNSKTAIMLNLNLFQPKNYIWYININLIFPNSFRTLLIYKIGYLQI